MGKLRKFLLSAFLTVFAGGFFLHAQNTVKVTGVENSADETITLKGVGAMAGKADGEVTMLEGD